MAENRLTDPRNENNNDTLGTRVGPGCRDITLAIKSAFWLSLKWMKSKKQSRKRERKKRERKSVITMVSTCMPQLK